MTQFLLVFGTLLLVVTAMAVGVIFSNRRIRGSCGGLNLGAGADSCPVCGKDAKDIKQGEACDGT